MKGFIKGPHGNAYSVIQYSAHSIQYLAVHKQVPYASSIVFVLQLWVFIRYVLIDPSKLQYIASIQIPGTQKQSQYKLSYK